jgi:hypothetical protein
MFQLEHDDFRALKDFKYLHHWTNPRWNVLPESDLAQIRPLREEKVRNFGNTNMCISTSSIAMHSLVPLHRSPLPHSLHGYNILISHVRERMLCNNI